MTRHLTPGDTAPAFTLTDARGASVSLADYAGKNVIVYFYPKAATPGCTTEACDFRDNLSSLAAVGYQVLGISPDAPEDIAAFADDQSLNFPLLSDPDNAVARAYGAYGDKVVNGNAMVGTLRSTFVVDGAGTLVEAEYDVDATGHVRRLREKLAA